MKITEGTIAVLKNFATINQSIIIHEGKVLNTVSNAKNLMGFSEVSETFPKTAAFYNLNQFINTLDLFDEPDLDFKATHVIISDDNNSVKFFYADESIINISNTVPKFSNSIIDFVLTKEDLSALTKAASTLNLPDLILVPADDSKLELKITDFENTTSNTFGRTVGENTLEGDFNFNFKTENLRLLPKDYDVSITGKSGRFLARFISTDKTVSYFMALELASNQS